MLQIGLAITFIWIGVMIIQSPAYWSGFFPVWLINISPFSPISLSVLFGVLDLIIGMMLLFKYQLHVAALLGALHLTGILIFSGIDVVTVRDVAILGGVLAVFIDSAPKSWRFWSR